MQARILLRYNFKNVKMNETRICLYCDEKINGRIDKKYCDDACRSSYNNRQNSDAAAMMKKVNIVLRRNRRILHELTPEATGKTKVTKKKLTDKGLNFDYITSTYTTKAGATYYFCYEYGYLQLENDIFILVKRIEN